MVETRNLAILAVIVLAVIAAGQMGLLSVIDAPFNSEKFFVKSCSQTGEFSFGGCGSATSLSDKNPVGVTIYGEGNFNDIKPGVLEVLDNAGANPVDTNNDGEPDKLENPGEFTGACHVIWNGDGVGTGNTVKYRFNGVVESPFTCTIESTEVLECTVDDCPSPNNWNADGWSISFDLDAPDTGSGGDVITDPDQEQLTVFDQVRLFIQRIINSITGLV